MSNTWIKLKGLREARAEKVIAMRTILDKGENEKRDLTDDETKTFDGLRAEIEKIDPEIVRLETMTGIEQRANVNPGASDSRAFKPAIGQPEQRQGSIFSPLNGEWQRRTALQNAAQETTDQLSLSKYLRGVIYGDFKNAEAERRALTTTGTGAAVVPVNLANQIISGSFNFSACARAGMQTIPMPTNSYKIPRMTGAPQAGFKAEGQAANVADGAVDDITLTSHTAMVVCKISEELAVDSNSVDADAIIMQEMSKAIALTIDGAALYGTGTLNDPVGLANISGVQSINSVGSLTNYSNFSLAAQRIMEVNGSPNAVILSPNSYGVLDRLTDSLGQPMRKPDSVAALNFLASNQVKLQPWTVTITGETGGTFTISVTAGGSTQTTSGIAYNATASTVSNALAALSNVGSGNVSVTGSAGGPYTITFAGYVGWLGAVKVAVDGTSLTGSSPAATATAVTSAFVGDFRQLLLGMRQELVM